MNTMDDVSSVIASIIERNRTEGRIEPGWVANEAMMTLDPTRVSPPAVYFGCTLWARQIAREQLRKKFEGQKENAQHDLFPELQWRYPAAHDGPGQPNYVLLELMTDADIAYNVDRLRQEAEAKLAHADALEDYGRRRKKAS